MIVEGEGHFVGKGEPDFIVFSGAVMHWVDGEPLSESEREEILQRVVGLADEEGMLVEVAY